MYSTNKKFNKQFWFLVFLSQLFWAHVKMTKSVSKLHNQNDMDEDDDLTPLSVLLKKKKKSSGTNKPIVSKKKTSSKKKDVNKQTKVRFHANFCFYFITIIILFF